MLNLQINPSSDSPIYQRIAEAVREAVSSGAIEPGQKLPAMTTLAKSLGVSALTVGRGYELLAADGIVTQKQGSGTYVQPDALRQVRPQVGRRVRTLFMVLGVDRLAEVARETLFIMTDVIDGINEVLDPRETHLVYVKSLSPQCLSGLGPDDAVVVRAPGEYEPGYAGELIRRGIRVVNLWESRPSLGDVPHVTKDHHQSAALAVQHLVACGYRRIGFIGRKAYHALPIRPKFTAFAEVLNNAGLDVSARYVRSVGTVPGEAYRAMREILDTGDLPEAFFVDTDYKAMEVVAALDEAGLRVPRDVGIVSYDDVPEAATFSPPLTSVRSPRREIGRRVAQMLLHWPSDGSMPSSITLGSDLIERESTLTRDSAVPLVSSSPAPGHDSF